MAIKIYVNILGINSLLIVLLMPNECLKEGTRYTSGNE